MKKITLNECEVNKNLVIYDIDMTNAKIARRLTELGFIIGAKVKILYKSTLKKTLLIEIQGYLLSMRSTVAELIFVRNL